MLAAHINTDLVGPLSPAHETVGCAPVPAGLRKAFHLPLCPATEAKGFFHPHMMC